MASIVFWRVRSVCFLSISLFASLTLLLSVMCGAAYSQAALPDWFPNTIHPYADAAACQLGARDDRYLPQKVDPTSANNTNGTTNALSELIDVENVPMFWDQQQLKWFGDPTTGTGEFRINKVKFGATANAECVKGDGTNCSTLAAPDCCFVSIVPGNPNIPGDATDGPYDNSNTNASGSKTGQAMRCDHFPYVDPSCTPDQYVGEWDQGGRCSDVPIRRCNTDFDCGGNVCLGGLCEKPCSQNSDCGGRSRCLGIVRWQSVFRRSNAAAFDSDLSTGQADFLPYGTTYYDVTDSNALKSDTYGTTWLDSLVLGQCSNDMTMDCGADAQCGAGNTCVPKGARSFEWGFQTNTAGIPRPGGLRPQSRIEGVRASHWFDEAATIGGGTPPTSCASCHGTVFNGSDWIAQSREDPDSTLNFNNDAAQGWWFAGNASLGVPQQPTFFDQVLVDGEATDEVACSSCHKTWAAESGGTPSASGNAMARLMTMVMGPTMPANPYIALAGGSPAYSDLASEFRTNSEATPPPAYGDRNTRHAFSMPPVRVNAPKPITVDTWTTDNGPSWDQTACCGEGLAEMDVTPTYADDPTFTCADISCEYQGEPGPLAATIPAFYTPWMAVTGNIPESPNQLVEGPDPVRLPSLFQKTCSNPKYKCFGLYWQDPVGRNPFNPNARGNDPSRNPYNAPANYYYQLETQNVGAQWDATKDADTEYCGLAGAKVPPNSAFVLTPTVMKQLPAGSPGENPGDQWRSQYTFDGVIPPGKQIKIRICGGWCPISAAGFPQGVVATNRGTLVGPLVPK